MSLAKQELNKKEKPRFTSKASIKLVGVPGFEPGTSNSRSWRANRTALHPEKFNVFRF